MAIDIEQECKGGNSNPKDFKFRIDSRLFELFVCSRSRHNQTPFSGVENASNYRCKHQGHEFSNSKAETYYTCTFPNGKEREEQNDFQESYCQNKQA